MGYYAGRVAVITGAGSGIGRALALRLATLGARLALVDRDAAAVTAAAMQCRNAGARTRADAVDVTDRAALLGCSTAVMAEFGRVDLVFCAAGTIHTGSLLSSDWADVDRVIAVNLSGVINTVKGFLPLVLASGGGRMVVFSSGFGLVSAPRYSAYAASKFAVRGFAESLRQEMALDGHPVSVTCVYPGAVRTPIVSRGSFAADADRAAGHGRFRPHGTHGPRRGVVRHPAPGAAGEVPGPGGAGRAGRRAGGARRRRLLPAADVLVPQAAAGAGSPRGGHGRLFQPVT